MKENGEAISARASEGIDFIRKQFHRRTYLIPVRKIFAFCIEIGAASLHAYRPQRKVWSLPV
jgi:hypothetical protein